jgi:hypothetical protein
MVTYSEVGLLGEYTLLKAINNIKIKKKKIALEFIRRFTTLIKQLSKVTYIINT